MWRVVQMLLIAFLCLPVVFPASLSAQVPWENLPVADSLYQAGAYEAALGLYQPVLKYYGDKKYLLKGARCAIQAGEDKLSLKYLDRMVDMGWANARLLQHEATFAPLRDTKKFTKLIKRIEAFEERSSQLKSDSLYAALDSLYANDQRYRRKKGMETEQAQLDSLNMIRLAQLIRQYGWLGSNLLSGRNYCWVVVQHQPLEIQEQYVGLMRKAVKKGEEERAYLAYLEDAILIAQGKKQKYGTMIDKENKKAYPLQDPEKVDMYRAQMGLGSYQGYLDIWNIE